MSLKTSKIIAIVAAISLALAACNNDEKQIRETAMGYLNATGNYRIDEAYPYATKYTQENTLIYLSDYLIPLADTNFIKSNTPATINIDSIFIIDDTAWVFYTKTTPLRDLKNQIYLIKENGKWLVDVPLAIPKNLPIGKTRATPDTAEHVLTRILPDSTEQTVKFRFNNPNPED